VIAATTRALLVVRGWLVCQGGELVRDGGHLHVLEDAVECWVVKARDVKNVPGRGPTF
jgi:transposase